MEEGVFAVVESTEKALLTDQERESELLVPIEKERFVNSVDGVTSKKLHLADTKAFVPLLVWFLTWRTLKSIFCGGITNTMGRVLH